MQLFSNYIAVFNDLSDKLSALLAKFYNLARIQPFSFPINLPFNIPIFLVSEDLEYPII